MEKLVRAIGRQLQELAQLAAVASHREPRSRLERQKRHLVHFDAQIRYGLNEHLPRYSEIERNVRRVARLVGTAGVRETARRLGLDKGTVVKYRRLARIRGLVDEEPAGDEDLGDEFDGE